MFDEERETLWRRTVWTAIVKKYDERIKLQNHESHPTSDASKKINNYELFVITIKWKCYQSQTKKTLEINGTTKIERTTIGRLTSIKNS